MTIDPSPPAGLPALNLKQARVVAMLREDPGIRDEYNEMIVALVQVQRLLEDYESDGEAIVELLAMIASTALAAAEDVRVENEGQQELLRVPLLDPEED